MDKSRSANRIRYIIEGGKQLAGEIEPCGNKNAALPIIAASLMTSQKVELSNIPRIRDVEVLVQLIQSVGAEVSWIGQNKLEIEAKNLSPADLDPELCARIRASILLVGPMLARCGELELPPPGGDVCQSAFKTGHLSASKTEQLNSI